MRLYIAGIYASNFHKSGVIYGRLTEGEKWQRDSVDWMLESYHYVHRQSYVDRMRRDGSRVFLDSGAFSAFTKGVDVDLPAYCRYIKENADVIAVEDDAIMASVLDGIGDPLKTYQNQMEMERLGVRPLPCFHYGEDERYLEHYISNYSYITLGGMVPISTEQLYHWLDRIWDKYLTDGSGRPRVKVHGFGLTTMELVRRYPWFSVDSSTWVQTARVGGMILVPEAKVIDVSSLSPRRKVAGQHIDTLPEVQRKAIEDRLAACRVDLERMRETYISRWAYNAWAFAEFGRMYDVPDPQFHLDKMELF